MQLIHNMKRWIAIALLASAPACAQKTTTDKAAEEQNRQKAAGEAARSTLEVKPGSPTIKTKDIVGEKSWAPWKRLPRYILNDQKHIWSSPFHTSQADVKWWAIVGGTTAVLLATDKWTSKQLPNTRDQLAVATWTSRFGASYSLLGLSSSFYVIGLGANNERFRETGILGFEALANSQIVAIAMKTVTHRERPLEGDGSGSFWSAKGSFWNSSFPSGHAINSWALASIVAHEYPRPLIVPIAAYGLATTVCASRFAVERHFASDAVLGGAIGWFIGDYIFARRHNRDLESGAHTSAIERVMSHVRIGGPPLPAPLPNPEAEKSSVLADMAARRN